MTELPLAAAPARTEPAPDADLDERAMLEGWLDYHRATLLGKCAGLTEEQLSRRPVPPSSLSLLGLLRHLTEVERGWFRGALAGEQVEPVYYSEQAPDDDFDDLASTPAAEVVARFEAECEHSRRLVAAETSYDVRSRGRDGRFSLRWIVSHMVEEYARHNGHADLLRECIDGSTGD
ncbi:putative damage-inducible protein DinB [Motilibacter peucedani]|uniref:Putative damage-inducible protein DinB n=1 Tax=Motilibacter peucedani TaxID=598650 RepID=A0A420XUF5_9ACTN|nr:DinB family protein [Motilibacter peucedani]RKS80483.1 putative damage-inducible protein DinB [Motilibacter peucedani]